MNDRLLVVSADGHAIAEPETFRPYLEKRYHHLFEELKAENEMFRAVTAPMRGFAPEVLAAIDPDNIYRDGIRGFWDVARRLEEMDREGVAAELLFYGGNEASTPFFGLPNRPYPSDVRAAGARAYHRWVADCMAQADGRLLGVADPGPCHDMDETLAELEWVASHGFVSVSVPGIVADPGLPHLCDEYYEPFWHACAELGLVLSVHAGHGQEQGFAFEFMRRVSEGRTPDEVRRVVSNGLEGSPFDHDVGIARVMWLLMLNGVFERYPNLQLALTEVRSDWVPATLAVLDRRFDVGDTPLRKSPSEYWHTNCWAGASSLKQSEVRLRNEIGIERMMFGRDYPHGEGTWPNTWDWLRDALVGVAEVEIRALLGENAVRCYGLDEAKLRAIAARIGPRPADIMRDGPSVDPRIVDHIVARGGYRKSMEVIDAEAVEDWFDQDLAYAASNRHRST